MRLPETAIVSVVIPCLNEEEPIAGVVGEVMAQGVDEIIVVDNGSTDTTAARAMQARSRVVREPRRGYGRACAAGFAAIRPDADIVCFLDGDGSDIPAFIPMVVGPVARAEADFVIGSRLLGRRETGSMTPQQLVAGHLAGRLMRLFYGVQFTDMSPFRAIRPQNCGASACANRPMDGISRCRCEQRPPAYASARCRSTIAAAAAAFPRSPETWALG